MLRTKSGGPDTRRRPHFPNSEIAIFHRPNSLIERNMTLDKIKPYMAEIYGFRARYLFTTFICLGILSVSLHSIKQKPARNCHEEMEIMPRRSGTSSLNKRKARGKETAVYLNGCVVPATRVKKKEFDRSVTNSSFAQNGASMRSPYFRPRRAVWCSPANLFVPVDDQRKVQCKSRLNSIMYCVIVILPSLVPLPLHPAVCT
jgi:hypothetical protein